MGQTPVHQLQDCEPLAKVEQTPEVAVSKQKPYAQQVVLAATLVLIFVFGIAVTQAIARQHCPRGCDWLKLPECAERTREFEHALLS